MVGWNHVIWAGGEIEVTAAGPDDDVVGPQGTRIFVKDPTDSVYDYRYRRNSLWYQSGSPSTLRLGQNQDMWLQMTNGSLVVWTPTYH